MRDGTGVLLPVMGNLGGAMARRLLEKLEPFGREAVRSFRTCRRSDEPPA